ncbi:MAG: hypothetical protein WC663_06250 [Patescibacteria group bacterium]|jgi:hypothetical protein
MANETGPSAEEMGLKQEETEIGTEQRPTDAAIDQKADAILALRDAQEEASVRAYNSKMARELAQDPELALQEENEWTTIEKTRYQHEKDFIDGLAKEGPKDYLKGILEERGLAGYTQEDFKKLHDSVTAKEQQGGAK